MMGSMLQSPEDMLARHGTIQKIPHPSSSLRTISPAMLQGKPIPQRKWVVPDWIPWHCTTSLYGDGGTGKSLLAMQLMTSISLGRHWIGLPTTKLKTWGLFCEDNPDELHIRQNDINRSYGCEFSDLKGMSWLSGVGEDNILMAFDPNGMPIITDFYERIEDDVLKSGAQFVVIDTAADTFGGIENSRGHVRQFIGLLTKLALKIDGGVLFCAHPSAAGMANGRGDGGSTGWNNSVRSRMYFTTPKSEDSEVSQQSSNERILKRMKANYAPRDEEIRLSWQQGTFIEEQQIIGGDVVTRISRDNRERDADLVFLRLLDELDGQGRTVSWSKNAANFAPKVMVKCPLARGFSLSDLVQSMERLFHSKKIRNEDYGRGKDSTKKIVRVPSSPTQKDECHGHV